MRRPVFLGVNPSVREGDYGTAAELFEATGGNTGNLAFLHATFTDLSGDVPVLPWGASPREVRQAGDIIVLPLANQLGSHTDLANAAGWLSDFDLPVIGVGLGAQVHRIGDRVSLTPGTTLWLSTLARLAPSDQPNLGVRGTFTAEQIAYHGHPQAVTVTGCPSNFMSGTDQADRIAAGFSRRPRRIAVTAGIPFIARLGRIEADLARLASDCDGSYIVQHGLEMIRLAYGEFDRIVPSELELSRGYITPDMGMADFKRWCRRHAIAFHDVPGWTDHLRTFDFVVGTRFHGVMLALQAGIPAGCITHDSRTEEMCETMAVPYCRYRDIGPLTPNTMMDYFRFDPLLYRETRQRLLARYVKLYRDADVAISERLKRLTANISLI